MDSRRVQSCWGKRKWVPHGYEVNQKIGLKSHVLRGLLYGMGVKIWGWIWGKWMAGGFKFEGKQDNGFEVRRAKGGHLYEIGVKIWGWSWGNGWPNIIFESCTYCTYTKVLRISNIQLAWKSCKKLALVKDFVIVKKSYWGLPTEGEVWEGCVKVEVDGGWMWT